MRGKAQAKNGMASANIGVAAQIMPGSFAGKLIIVSVGMAAVALISNIKQAWHHGIVAARISGITTFWHSWQRRKYSAQSAAGESNHGAGIKENKRNQRQASIRRKTKGGENRAAA